MTVTAPRATCKALWQARQTFAPKALYSFFCAKPFNLKERPLRPYGGSFTRPATTVEEQIFFVLKKIRKYTKCSCSKFSLVIFPNIILSSVPLPGFTGRLGRSHLGLLTSFNTLTRPSLLNVVSTRCVHLSVIFLWS